MGRMRYTRTLAAKPLACSVRLYTKIQLLAPEASHSFAIPLLAIQLLNLSYTVRGLKTDKSNI